MGVLHNNNCSSLTRRQYKKAHSRYIILLVRLVKAIKHQLDLDHQLVLEVATSWAAHGVRFLVLRRDKLEDGERLFCVNVEM